MRSEPTPMPDTWPADSRIRARRGAVPLADVRTRAVLRRQTERSTSGWLEAVALVEHVAPLSAVDDSEPPRCGKREAHQTVARGVRARKARRA
jgi:hypothetical protein